MSASKMRGFVEKDDFDSFLKGTPMKSKDAREMFDKLKEGMKLDESYITEVLKPSDPLEKWIKDFLKSDDPRFDGKSKKKRIEMATAAYYSAQEESVSLDEVLSKSARRKMSIRMKQQSKKLARKREISMKKTASPEVIERRARKMAIDHLKKKLLSGKNIDELSPSQRERLEKMVKNKKTLIDSLTKKFIKIVKQKEKERKQGE